MSIVSYIVIALALGICNMLLFRRCGESFPIRLSAGITVSFTVSAVHVILYLLGALIGSLLCFYSPDNPTLYADINAYIFLGINIIVIIKGLLPYLRRNPRLPLFDLTSRGSVLAMAAATGINALLIGLGVGFVEQHISIHKIIWPLLTTSLLFSYLGLMFGRREVTLRPRRWMIVASVLLLGVAIAAVVNA